jgi:putative transposase
MAVPTRDNERWSVDFVSDQLANGRRFRVLNVVDDFSRECVLQVVDLSISAQCLARELSHLGGRLPRTIVCDNGPELTSKALFFWARESGVKLHFIQPGKPTQNAFVESFNGKFRDYYLDLHWFASIDDARSPIDEWRTHYNEDRPHRSLGRKPPARFAREVARRTLVPTLRVARIKGYGHTYGSRTIWTRFTSAPRHLRRRWPRPSPENAGARLVSGYW